MKFKIKSSTGAALLLITPLVTAAETGSTSSTSSTTGVPCVPNSELVRTPPDPVGIATLVIVSLTLGGVVGWVFGSRGRNNSIGS